MVLLKSFHLARQGKPPRCGTDTVKDRVVDCSLGGLGNQSVACLRMGGRAANRHAAAYAMAENHELA
jgi:hypothetical protein